MKMCYFFQQKPKKNLNNNIRCEIAIIIVSTGRNTRKPVQILRTNNGIVKQIFALILVKTARLLIYHKYKQGINWIVMLIIEKKRCYFIVKTTSCFTISIDRVIFC